MRLRMLFRTSMRWVQLQIKLPVGSTAMANKKSKNAKPKKNAQNMSGQKGGSAFGDVASPPSKKKNNKKK